LHRLIPFTSPILVRALIAARQRFSQPSVEICHRGGPLCQSCSLKHVLSPVLNIAFLSRNIKLLAFRRSLDFPQSRAKQSLIVCRLYQGGARRQNRTVPAYGLPPITARRSALLTASLDPPRSSNGNEIAIPAVSLPKGQAMIVKKTNQPTHRVYAVRKTGQDSSYWAEIGAAWANKDGKGFSLKLNLLPVGEADIVVREIPPEADAEGGAQ
jgi:hypothetical protein